jgi:hypothetical protein
MVDFLQTLNNNDIVCFVDGFDVICNRNLNELKDEFLKIKNNNNDIQIICGIDIFKNNIVKFFNKLYFKTLNTESINSGTYIGYASDLLIILNETHNLNLKYIADDQYLLIEYYKKNKKIFYLDNSKDFFVVINNSLFNIDTSFEIKDNIAYYNNKQPFFIHGPGYTNLNNLIQKLNYKISNKDKKIIFNKMKKNIINKIRYYLKDLIKRYLIFIILFIVIFFIIKNKKSNTT